MKNLTTLANLLLLLLVFSGAWIGGSHAWGFNHFSYLPATYFIIWSVLAGVSLLPAVQNSIAASFQKTIPDLVLRTRFGPLVPVLVLGSAFFLLQGQSLVLGDGLLIINLVEQGTPFRVFDNMDFFLHSRIFQISPGITSAESLYRSGSILAGILAITLFVYLLKQLPWELWRRALVLALFMFSGPVLLFFGYIESYAYLFIFISCFLISGVLYLEKKLPLYVASSFLGLAMFFHLSAFFCLPALVSLLFLDSGRKNWHRFPAAILPPLLIFSISILIHIRSGYSTQWFQHDFMENSNLQQLFISPFGENGFFSLSNLSNQWNLFLIIAPVSFLIVFLRVKNLFARRYEPALQFLFIHLLTIGLICLVIDRKLGAARDWDLLVAHTASLYILAAMAISSPNIFPGKALSLAITTSFLCVMPWIVLEASEERSINRFIDVAKGFSTPARAHAFEDLGQYYRENGQLEESLKMYEQCILADPHHYRYYSLSGAANISLARESKSNSAERDLFIAKAKINLEEALRRNPLDISARRNLAKLLLLSGKPQLAKVHFLELVKAAPADPYPREQLAFCLISILEQDLSTGRKPDVSVYLAARDLIGDLLKAIPSNKNYQAMNTRIESIGLSFPQSF